MRPPVVAVTATVTATDRPGPDERLVQPGDHGETPSGSPGGVSPFRLQGVVQRTGNATDLNTLGMCMTALRSIPILVPAL